LAKSSGGAMENISLTTWDTRYATDENWAREAQNNTVKFEKSYISISGHGQLSRDGTFLLWRCHWDEIF
jgi:hypothetical protein